jgi:hypothetical protein
MQLLLQRSQSEGTLGRIKFALWAKFELAADEQALIDKYRASNAILSEGDRIRDLKRAALYGAGLAILGALLFRALGLGLPQAVLLGLLAFAAAACGIYQQIREEIRVSDILAGRSFSCRSVVTLMEKEKTVTDMAVVFRRFLEAMKDWGGKEIIDIAPDQEPVLRTIEPPHAAA